ncbi:light-harvesting complex I chlorophyll a/b binding protein 2 [Klebsormidium nitens]|uniref:Chlorophyll a-b binding protein, chloroplastic n=1 Tax=Klebsormidium nitens TaxID=105231 RepID=A0A1Y1IEM7_KLENI|nr:light-harvesting complex I chlorophyll a/b binding protein 2 [Klebsormidium nitens]|eukprot:GAQ89394.1 light-harvesting complex I chlorophyll a/b binding protein 2 [Klebsormidium nitens]
MAASSARAIPISGVMITRGAGSAVVNQPQLRTALAGCRLAPQSCVSTGRIRMTAGGSKTASGVRKTVGSRRKIAAENADAVWIPGFERPAHLDGFLPGDRGFDPLNIAVEEGVRNRVIEGEVLNGRWAMLACLGALVPDLLGKGNFGDLARSSAWLGGPVLGLEPVGIPTSGLGLAFLLVIGACECIRLNAEVRIGYESYDDVSSFVYPGFDPLGFLEDKTEEEVNELRTKELKNGRLAMVSFIGFLWQYLETGEGPITNHTKHLADPSANWLFNGSPIVWPN